MTKEVRIGDKINVTIKLEFEGTIRNHAILVENQFIPTINNQRVNYEIALNGDPVQILGRFTGVQGSSIKKFEVQINGKTGYKVADVKFKYEEIEINVPVSYIKFDLIAY
jgi:S-adenosylmethionine synthetase